MLPANPSRNARGFRAILRSPLTRDVIAAVKRIVPGALDFSRDGSPPITTG